MTYIPPNSRVDFYPELGISPNYENSLYFASASDRNTYFNNLTKIASATAMSYSRAERGFIRVQLPMATLINAGYMRFQNTSFENKWFYAFVTDVEYINNECTEVKFELDYLMTWMGLFTLNECYIERQHTTVDGIGQNIIDEGINCGDYICEGSSMTAFFGSYEVATYKSFNKDKDDLPQYQLSQGTYVPLVRYFYGLNSHDMEQLNEYIDTLIDDNRQDELMCMKLVPEHWTDTEDVEAPPYDTFSVTKPYSNIGGTNTPYVPRNKKLYTYPYKYLQVENCEGDSVAYHYEWFETLPGDVSSGSAYFHIMGTACTPETSIMCTPKNYRGEQYAWDESVDMKNFPTIAWNIDGYRAYLAQRDSTIFGNTLGGILTGAASGLAYGGLTGAAVNATSSGIANITPLIKDVGNDLMKGDLPSRFPTKTKGNAESNLMVQSQNKNFYFRRMSITKELAKVLDDFFDLYGYAIKRHGTPLMNARPVWTYVKTIGCSISGNMPADHARRIESIFDNGIRFWKDHTKIGKYSLYDNRIVENG